MRTVKAGDKVSIAYTGRLVEGPEFDSASEKEPLTFVVGSGAIISGVDDAVKGMKVGDKKSVTIAPDKGYGSVNDGLIVTVKREQLPQVVSPEVGQQVRIMRDDGKEAIMMVTEMSGDKVTLDANHPLAGRTLKFDITLVSIEGA